MRDFRLVAGPLDFGAFLTLPDDARASLAVGAGHVVAPAGARILHEGERGDAAYVLMSGLVRAESDGVLLGLLSGPALLGEIAVLDDVPRTASVCAEAECRLLRIDREALREAAAAHPRFAAAMRDRVRELAAYTFLRKGSPFAELPSEALRDLARVLEPVALSPGEVLFRQGDADDDVFLVRRGSIAIARDDRGTERRVATVEPGQFIGEGAALTGEPRSATACAIDRVEAYRVRGAAIRQLVRRHSALVASFAGALSARHRPRRASHVSMTPCPDDPHSVILRNDENGAYLKVTREVLGILEDLDGEHNMRDLALLHLSRTSKIDASGLFHVVATLQTAGFATAPRLARDAARASSNLRTKLLDLILAPRLEVKSADLFAHRLQRVLWPLTTPLAVWAAVALGAIGVFAFAFQFRTLSLDTFGASGILVAWVGLFVAGLGHELTHLLACKAFGSRVGRAGIGLMWFSPLIYVDTTDTWTLTARQRVIVNAAGPLFNLACAGALSLLALRLSGTADDLVLWLAGMNYLSVIFNLSPFLEFDGYYVLSDIANAPMLRRRALRFVFRDLADHPRLPRGRFEWGLLGFSLAFVSYALIAIAFVTLTVSPGIETVLAGRVSADFLVFTKWATAATTLILAGAPLAMEIRSARTIEVSDDGRSVPS